MLQNIINITGTMTNNSYHWLADYLPRLEYFCEKLKKEDYYLLIDNKPTKYQLETLELFGIPSKKILRWTGGKTLCHNAFIPCMRYVTHPSGIQIYSINSMNWVRTKLLKSTEDVPKKIKNIYITRKKASSRNLLNENRFIDYLNQYNFECLCLEDLSAKEIIAKFRDSKIIIAVHGAALSHTLFSSNCKIIEIFPSNFTEKTNRNPTHLSLHPFFQISSLFKLNHFVYVVQGNENFDINININEFSHFFESKILNLL